MLTQKSFIPRKLLTGLLFLLITVLIPAPDVLPQSLNLSVSGKSDSLSAYLLKNPPQLQQILQLCDEYIRKGYYELALIELNDKNSFIKTPDSYVEELHGNCLFFLNKPAEARRTLINAYLLKPSERILFKLALLEYVAGDSAAALATSNRIKKRNPDYFVQLKDILAAFNDGNSLIPQKSLRLLQYNDPENYAKYFIKPSVTLKTIIQGNYTKDSILTISFNIAHNKPVKNLIFNDRELFRRDNDRYSREEENYTADFAEKFPLKPGMNTTVIKAKDIFGLESATELKVFCDRFPSAVKFTGDITDSLNVLINYTGSFINLGQLVPDSVQFFNIFLYDSKSDIGSIPLLSGLTSLNTFNKPEDAAVSNRYVSELSASDETAEFIFSSPEIIPSGRYINLCLRGKWNKTTDDYQLILFDRIISIKKLCESVKQLDAPGLNLVIDGFTENKPDFADLIKSILSAGKTPFNIIITGDDFSKKLMEFVMGPITGSDTLFRKLISFSDYKNQDAELYFGSSDNSLVIPFCTDLFGRARLLHLSRLDELKSGLASRKLGAQQEQKILSFLSNWKMYNELTRYLSDLITIKELNARIDEYNERMKELKKE